jgi:hypothetical protein
VVLNFPSFDTSYNKVQPNSVIIQPDQKILIGVAGEDSYGYYYGTNVSYFAMARLNSDGTPDTTFGTSGMVENDLGVARALFMQPDGHIVQVGFSDSNNVSKIILARFTSGLSSGPVDSCRYPSFPFSEIPVGLLSVYPNPTNGIINLLVSVTEQQSLNVQVYDMLGKPVMTSSSEVNPGLTYNSYGIGSLPQGNYVMRIQLGSQTYTKKLVKIE